MRRTIIYSILTILFPCLLFAQNEQIDSLHINFNKLDFTFLNNGIILPVGKYEDKKVLWTAGFLLSGYYSDTLFCNGAFDVYNLRDFTPDNSMTTSPGKTPKFYVVLNSDMPFGESWQEWSEAVEQGALFYDGDGDNKYEPIDKNGNNKWDENEDRPDLLGDFTAWCVYSDNVNSENRYYKDMKPLGIEIRQTVFGSIGDSAGLQQNALFVRYIIENKGLVANVLDSVIFSVALDPDIGNSEDDLGGCDTLGNYVFAYNQGPDDDWESNYGNNPPALLVDLLQGPQSSIPGKTFLDQNGNGIFDIGIDIPLDTAKLSHGIFLGEELIPGYANLNMSAVTVGISSHPTLGSPGSPEKQRYLQIGGKDLLGREIDVCSWNFGNGNELADCSQINPKYMYSGNPVDSTGWLNNFGSDIRIILSTGPFKLEVGKPIELLIAYIVNRGEDEINSLVLAKSVDNYVQNIYESNFNLLPTGIIKVRNGIRNYFNLYQNYPNPFNPSTTIKYSIPQTPLNPPFAKGGKTGGFVTLKIYDILGREIATLVKEKQEPGEYEVKFNAKSAAGELPSGIYFYTLRAGGFVQTRKMILLK